MRFYYRQKDCEYCGKDFEASRQDARFCGSSCRTANHRREKRREAAQESITAEFEPSALHAYTAVCDGNSQAANQLRDIYIESGTAAAAAATVLAYSIMTDILTRTENQLRKKDETIQRLREDAALLDDLALKLRARNRR
jgi:hypothetical protein